MVNRAVALAKRRNAGIEGSVFDFLRDILLFKFPPNTDAAGIAEHEHFVMKFQQCTGPIMAKGLEDTAFYIYNRLVALNEVGGEPQRFGIDVAEFHRTNAHDRRKWPHTMLATSTHDTKRAEDTRARVAALSEMPKEWRRALRSWSALNRKHKGTIEGEHSLAPDLNEEYLVYQILLGTWPMRPAGEGEGAAKSAFATMSAEEHAVYVGRIQEYMTKAIKEAKVNSSWVQPNEGWDEGVRKFIAAILKRGKGANAFVRAFEPMAERIAQMGVINSLSQTVLKLTVPGVPDIYQGCDLWDFSLVDPDNRRPVDYEAHRRTLASLKGADPREMLDHWTDGRIKLFITRTLLQHRLADPELYKQGSYRPLKVTGKFAGSVVAFAREHETVAILVIVPRLASKVGLPPVGEAWGNTAVVLEESDQTAPWKNLFTGGQVKTAAGDGTLTLAVALANFPWAVLTRG